MASFWSVFFVGVVGSGRFAQSATLNSTELDNLNMTMYSSGGMMLIANNSRYVDFCTPYSTLCTERPHAVFVPASEAGLRSVIIALVNRGADFVVTTSRLNQDCQSTSSGYVINMRLFQKRELNSATTSIRLGAGNSVDDANSYVQHQGDGQYFVVGVVGHWGNMVGPIFGGGFYWNFYSFGTMSDNAIEFRFMDYRGEVYTANSVSNSDLFWALRGGGGQLGVVIEVVMRVHRFPSTNRYGSFNLPCAGACKGEDAVAALDRVGRWYNTLNNSISAWFLIGAFTSNLDISCDGCDLDALVTSAFPGAVAQVPGQNDVNHVLATRHTGNVRDFMAWVRWCFRGMAGPLPADPRAYIEFDFANSRYPTAPLIIGSYHTTAYEAGIADVFQEVLTADPYNLTATAVWTCFFGGITESNDGNNAASIQKGAKQHWAAGNFAGDDFFMPIMNRGMTKLPSTKYAFWNYKNKYTSEEFAFTSNFERIREIRNTWDPNGVFALPPSKNQGSVFIDSCFAPYHCYGRGQLASSSLNGTFRRDS